MWQKLGLIYKVSKSHSKNISHAANPLALHLENDVFRIFYSGRDADNKSSVSFVDIDIVTKEIVNDNIEPVFCYGNDKSFFSHGVSIGNIYECNNKQYILFMGWQIPESQHWKGDIGRLELKNKSQLILTSEKPFMGSDSEDEISLSYPWVIYHENIYKMWYGSTITWDAGNGEMLHVIKYATSIDGENWQKHGLAISYELGVAQAFSRPSVIIDDKGYHMWYSYRSGSGQKYRIGYSHSIDGKSWNNKLEEAGIDVSPTGWDSEMICYPFIFEHRNKRYMLYNGNGYGKEGFGLAVWNQI